MASSEAPCRRKRSRCLCRQHTVTGRASLLPWLKVTADARLGLSIGADLGATLDQDRRRAASPALPEDPRARRGPPRLSQLFSNFCALLINELKWRKKWSPPEWASR